MERIKFENEVICQICNYKHPTTIQNHIRFKHPDITIQEYYIKYNSEITSEELKRKRAEKSSVKKGPMLEEQKQIRSQRNKQFWENADDKKKQVSKRMKLAAEKGFHPSQTDSFKKMAGENAIIRNKTDKQKEAVKAALTGIKLSKERIEKSAAGHRGIPLSEETKRKISIAHKNTFASGNRQISGKFIGKIWSDKNNKYIYYRSELELIYIVKLENDISVKIYKTDYPHIKYELNNEIFTYFPDFFINEKDIVEINSYTVFYLNKDKKEAKAEAARKYCQENSLTYKILYEDDLGVEYSVPDYIKNYNFPHS